MGNHRLTRGSTMTNKMVLLGLRAFLNTPSSVVKDVFLYQQDKPLLKPCPMGLLLRVVKA